MSLLRTTPAAVGAVVLAAGAGRRFGGQKLLAPLHGRPVVVHVLEAVRQARAVHLVDDAIAVIAPGDWAVADLAGRAGLRTVENASPALGLSGSLRCGLRSLGAEVGAAALLLADQPLVRVEVLAVLIAAWRAGLGTLVRPRYADAPDEPGHPVLVDRSLWHLADALSGEAGLGALFPPGSAGVAVIEVAGRNPDVDTPDDLTTLEGSSS
jgi:molybdenum cofactor cytidylyltransferase